MKHNNQFLLFSKKIIRTLFSAILISSCFLVYGCNSSSADIDNSNSEDTSSAEDSNNTSDENSSKNDVSKDNSCENKNSTTASKKDEYLTKLQKVQDSLSDLKSKYAGNTNEMKAAAKEEYTRWDNALNDIYSELKNELSKDEMAKLQKEEQGWIKDRDNKARESADKVKGGTAEGLYYTQSLIDSTKQRCYYLVNNFIK